MIKAIITINLTLTGPILTQSSSPSAWGLDMVAARNTEGYFYLPGTLVVGKLRQAWQELEAAVRDEQNWFTPEFAKWLGEANENDIPNTKQLYFSDLVYQGDEDSNAVLNRIEIDEERGAVAENQLVVIQSPFLTGDDYLFTGELHFFANNHEEVNKIVRHVEAGLHWTAQLGAMRTVGFGRVKSVTCSTITKELSKPDLPAQLPAVKNFTLIIRPLYPFCITDKPVADNLFESIYIIPGSVILGSIVTTWNHLCKKSGGRTDDINDEQRTKLKDYFSSIRISHALPSEEVGTRPISLPLSLVKVPKDDDLYDVILLDKPCLINGETPAFAIDWKEDANSDYGWPQITKELRTRTHIDPETLRSADKDLFSYEQIAPKSLNWNAVIDLSRISENDRNAVFSELQSLLSEGIAALSKTKT
ncbi:MAG: RAMP superfamily CRISPR-associated protein, partial [Methylobacter sp.]